MAEQVHKHHRQRLKNNFLQHGLSHFEDHQILEMLLFYAIPHKDTNPTAHRLLSRFGSLDGVFSASSEQLQSVQGVGAYVADFLRFYGAMSDYTAVRTFENDRPLLLLQDLGAYFVDYYRTVPFERTLLLLLDNQSKIIDLVSLGDCHFTSPRISFRKVAELAMEKMAAIVVFAHNHPNGTEIPSSADLDLTHTYEQELYGMGVRLAEHVVVSGERFLRIFDTKRGLIRQGEHPEKKGGEQK